MTWNPAGCICKTHRGGLNPPLVIQISPDFIRFAGMSGMGPRFFDGPGGGEALMARVNDAMRRRGELR